MNKELLKLLRLNNALIAFVGVWVGMACLYTPLDIIPTLLGALIFSISAMIGNVHNDLVDLKTDKINRPSRPLVSNKVSKKQAYFLILILSALLVLVTYYHPWNPWYWSLGLITLLFFYNRSLKQTPLLGNFLVGFLCASPLLFVLERHNFTHELIFTVGFAFFLTLIREIVKDIEDHEGDSRAKLCTTAVYFGKKTSRKIAFPLVILCVLGLYLPVSMGWFRPTFSIFSALLLAPTLFIFSLKWKTRRMSDKEYSSFLKQVMIWGMISIFADRFWAV